MWVEKIVGDFDDKKRYREYRQRIKRLPEGYHQAARALERYLMNLGPSGDGKSLITMLGDLADLLEQSAAAGTPIRDVVGADPVEFAETFGQAYVGERWIDKERSRLTKAIEDAERDGTR